MYKKMSFKFMICSISPIFFLFQAKYLPTQSWSCIGFLCHLIHSTCGTLVKIFSQCSMKEILIITHQQETAILMLEKKQEALLISGLSKFLKHLPTLLGPYLDIKAVKSFMAFPKT